ncbi:MAG: hypothetical protein JSW15_00315 [Deltaproteobacteria bacterium]|nr:MAG: hypothetical protein JSW15_00315 [Deltaproteobacteria bacterium]
MKFSKKLAIWIVLGAVFYFLLSYHFIFIDNTVKLLRKSSLSLNYTIFSAKGKTNKSILSIDELREDGIGDLLVEMGRMSEEEMERLEAMFE